MDDSRQLIHHQISQLSFDRLLQVIPDERDGIKGRRDLKRLEGVISKHYRETLLLGEYQYDKC